MLARRVGVYVALLWFGGCILLPKRCGNVGAMRFDQFLSAYQESNRPEMVQTSSPQHTRTHARFPSLGETMSLRGKEGGEEGGGNWEDPSFRENQMYEDRREGAVGGRGAGDAEWGLREEGGEAYDGDVDHEGHVYEGGWVQMNEKKVRQFIPAIGFREGDLKPNSASLRILSYNVLGEVHATSAIHNYCPAEFRVWEGPGGRRESLVHELRDYDADVLCLQEVTPNMFERDLIHEMIGYEGLHVSMMKRYEELKREGRCVLGEAAKLSMGVDDIGLCTFVKEETCEIVTFKRVFYRDILLPDRPAHGYLRDKLESLTDGVLISLIKSRKNGRLFIAANVHLFWQPTFPNVKVLQAELACMAIRDFRTKHNLNESVPVVLCGDLNSVRDMQLEFIPPIQRASVLAAMGLDEDGGVDANKQSDEDAEPVPRFVPVGFDRSGVYQLLSVGTLEPGHPEHPDSFGKANAAKPWKQMTPLEKQRMRFNKKMQRGLPTVGLMRTFLNLTNCYEAALGCIVPLTTKTDTFAGAIDYIWHTEPLVPARVLELPYKNGDDFFPIPDSWFPSDHLSLGADFVWRQDVKSDDATSR